MIGVVLFSACLFVMVSWATSLSIGLLVRRLRGAMRRYHPAARARLWWIIACAPGVLAVSVVGGALWPREWLGEPGHCLAHAHAHLCVLCGAPSPNAVASTALVVGGAWLVWSIARATARALRGLRRIRALPVRRQGRLRIVADERLLAFTVGLWRPVVYVSSAVVDERGRWEAVIAHELAHAEQRDPLRRLTARLATGLHLPSVADIVLREMEEAQELAADEHAAAVVGERTAVAEALLRWVRAARVVASHGVAFETSTLTRRVAALLEVPRYRSGRGLSSPAALVVIGLITFACASPLHHPLEHALALFVG